MLNFDIILELPLSYSETFAALPGIEVMEEEGDVRVPLVLRVP